MFSGCLPCTSLSGLTINQIKAGLPFLLFPPLPSPFPLLSHSFLGFAKETERMSSLECEGFICPYCLVGFASQGLLQSHFLEMHSGLDQVDQEDEYDDVECKEEMVSGGRLSHWTEFQVVKKQQHRLIKIYNWMCC